MMKKGICGMIGTRTPITPRMKKKIAHARLWALPRFFRRAFFTGRFIRPGSLLPLEDLVDGENAHGPEFRRPDARLDLLAVADDDDDHGARIDPARRRALDVGGRHLR